jgi:hypothetical protein
LFSIAASLRRNHFISIPPGTCTGLFAPACTAAYGLPDAQGQPRRRWGQSPQQPEQMLTGVLLLKAQLYRKARRETQSVQKKNSLSPVIRHL